MGSDEIVAALIDEYAIDWQLGIAIGHAIECAVLAERERCMRLCEDTGRDGGTAWDAAAAIREEG